MSRLDPDTARRLLGLVRTSLEERHKQDRRTARRFNVFSAIGMDAEETRHSRFLAHLIDPAARHDQRSFFLQGFLALCAANIPAEQTDAHACVNGSCDGARVTTEFVLDNGLGRMDIVVLLPGQRAVCIENKIWASEQSDQVRRYQRWLRQAPEARHGKLVIYLSPDGHKPTTADPPGAGVAFVARLSYGQVADWLQAISPRWPESLTPALQMYGAICRSLSEDMSMEYDAADPINRELDADLETAIALAEIVEAKKDHIVVEFWRNVEAAVSRRLDEAGLSASWKAAFAGDRSHSLSQFGIVPVACEGSKSGPPNWTPDGAYVMAEALGHAGDQCVIGIRAPKALVPARDGLSAILQAQRFITNDWWAGWRYLTLQDGSIPLPSQSAFFASTYRALNDDNRSGEPAHPIANEIARQLWDLFSQYREILAATPVR